MYMIVPLTIYVLERLVRLVLPHVRNTQLVDVRLMGGNEKARLLARIHVRPLSVKQSLRSSVRFYERRAEWRGGAS